MLRAAARVAEDAGAAAPARVAALAITLHLLEPASEMPIAEVFASAEQLRRAEAQRLAGRRAAEACRRAREGDPPCPPVVFSVPGCPVRWFAHAPRPALAGPALAAARAEAAALAEQLRRAASTPPAVRFAAVCTGFSAPRPRE